MLYIFGGFDGQIDLNLVFSLISSVVLYCPPCLGCVGRECQAWMCKCLLQCEAAFICSTLGFLIHWIPNCSPGGVPTVLPLHKPSCLQLCHWRQPYWGNNVFWGFPFPFISFAPKVCQFCLLLKLTGHCLLRLPLIYYLCRLPVPGRLSLNKRIVFGWVLHALK